MNEDLEILRKGNSELRKENEKIKIERDKLSKQYLDLYAKLEETRQLVKELMKKEKFKIEKDDFIYMSLEHLGDLKQIFDILNRR